MDLKFHFPATLGKMKRGPAIIHPKDAGLIIAHTGVGKNSEVVEAGAGSGFLTVQLANICKKVYSYERKPEFFELAKGNVERAGFENVEMKNKDIFEGIEEKGMDLVSLDMPDAEKAVPIAFGALKAGGWCVGYLPNVEQAKDFYMECHKTGFGEIFMLESLVREYEVREYGVRPQHIGLTHTAYLVFARK
ncbi:tRNA (adenine(57)-N(1)/adenine(58)-N(1))-methyltransferase TrmI [uncultured archaeon]|nr:tRNA (adenine(57)-N(1)/adenine(58)-N(1))-methyltransferase TrmI [uncultured archaeon]